MAFKIFFFVCIEAIIIQCAFSQSIGYAPGVSLFGQTGRSLAGAGCGCAGVGLSGPSLRGPGFVTPGLLAPSVSGSFGASCGSPITSGSPITPIGLTIISENTIEGSLFVSGELPFLGTVAVEGLLPTSGSGAVSYGCGNAGVSIVSESPVATGIVSGYGASLGEPGYGSGFSIPAFGHGLGYSGFAGVGCGCGL